jgi:hypothetical protein
VSHFSRKRLGRIAVTAAGVATALTLGFWAQVSAAQPSAPSQRIAAPPATVSAPAAGGSGSSVNVIARDYSFEAPSTVSTGVVTLDLQNQGAEPHHAQIVRLNDGVTMEAFGGALMQDPEAAFPLVSFEGGPSVVDPAGSSQVTLNFSAGNYVMLCFVENDQGVPHLALGMIKPFQVAPPPSTAQAPQASGEVILKDFTFEAPRIQAGERTLKVTNQGPQVHEMAVIRANAPADEVMQALANFDEEPPFEVTNFGGMQALGTGKSGWVTMNFTPGTNVMLCFVPDPESGAPHVALGMVKAFTVE